MASSIPPGEVLQDLVKSEMKVKGLPAGWRREVVVRKNGQSAGKTDVYYYSPCGKKFRSKPQIARFLGDAADLTVFDFSRAGTPGDGSSRRGARDRSSSRRAAEAAKHVPPPIRPLTINPLRESGPVRRTCGVIKLPVTCFAPPSDEEVRKSTIQMEISVLPAAPPEPQQQPQQQPSPAQVAPSGGQVAPSGAPSGAEAIAENMPKPPEQSKQTPQNPPAVANAASAVVLPLLWENSLKGVKAHDHETRTEIDITPKLGNGFNHSAAGNTTLTAKDSLGAAERKPLATGGGSLDSKPQMLGALLAAKPGVVVQNAAGVKSQSPGNMPLVGSIVPSLLAHGKKSTGNQRTGPVVVTSLKNVQENGSLVTTTNQNNVSNIVLTFPSVASANAFKSKQTGVISMPAQRQGHVMKSVSVAQQQASSGATISLASSSAASFNLGSASAVNPGHYRVSESELRLQEEKVKLLRKQLLAAQSTV